MRTLFVVFVIAGLCTSAARGATPPLFAVTNVTRTASGEILVGWQSETNGFTNLFFRVEGAPSLNAPFALVSPQISEAASLSFTDSVLSAASSAFYRVSASPAFTQLTQPGAFSAYAATNVNGLNTAGYAGAVFDGRYVYFAPYNSGSEFSGNVLRFDARLPRVIPPTVTGGSNL